MKPALVIVAVGAFLAAAVGCSERSTAPKTPSAHRKSATASSSAPAQLPPPAPAGQTTLWGHVVSLARKNGHFELRFDPALFLHGLTADRAAAQDGVEAANDYYVAEESHRLFTYVVATDAPVTVVTRGDNPSTKISVAELAQIVAGRNPQHRPLLEPQAGFWIRVGDKYPNPVLSLDQQYQP
jgi:hypothetical protein